MISFVLCHLLFVSTQTFCCKFFQGCCPIVIVLSFATGQFIPERFVGGNLIFPSGKLGTFSSLMNSITSPINLTSETFGTFNCYNFLATSPFEHILNLAAFRKLQFTSGALLLGGSSVSTTWFKLCELCLFRSPPKLSLLMSVSLTRNHVM